MAGHAAYIRAVASALEAAGVPVADWRADDGVPRDGWIPFDLVRQVRLFGRPVWDHDQAGLGWDEDQGWYVLTVDDPYGRGLRTTKKLSLTRLAAPHSVVRAVARQAGIAVPGLAGDDAGPDFPDHRAVARQAGIAVPALPEADAGPDFPDHRADRPDPGFEAALLRYAHVAQSAVDASEAPAEGRRRT